MKEHYHRLVIGATYHGCGIAAAAPEDTLVVEDSILVGSDFSLNFNPGTQWDYMPSHSAARKFRDDLIQRGALLDKCLHQPAMTPVFSQWCLDMKLEIALATRLLEHCDKEAVLFDAEGRHRVSFDELIDTRPPFMPGGSKRITASLYSDGPGCAGNYEHFKIIAGRFEREAFLLMELAADCTWPDARMALFNAWQKRPQALKDCSIAAVGVRFDLNNYPNPVIALDNGLIKGESCITM